MSSKTRAEERRAEWDRLTPRQRLERKRQQYLFQIERPDFNMAIVNRAKERMSRMDAFPPDIRALVHEFGLEIVQEFWTHGVRKAKSIRHLILVVRGERTDGGNRFNFNKGPNSKRNPMEIEDEYWTIKK